LKQKFASESLRPFIDMDGLKGDEIVERKQYVGEIKVMADEEKTIVARISTISVDGDADIVLPNGADLTRFIKNPVIHADHSYKVEDVIGKAIEIGVDEVGIVAKIKFADTPRANDAWQLVKGGFVKANSIGFIIKEAVYKGSAEFNGLVNKMGLKVADTCSRIITKFELLESSIVSVPCNPDALMMAISAKSLELSAKTIEMLDLPKVIIVEEKDIVVVSKPEVAEVAPVTPEAPEVPVVEAQAVVPVVDAPAVPVDAPEAPIVAEPVVAVVPDVAPVVEPAESAEPARSISIVSTPEPARSITLIRSLKVVRNGDVDAKAEARKIILAKKGKVI